LQTLNNDLFRICINFATKYLYSFMLFLLSAGNQTQGFALAREAPCHRTLSLSHVLFRLHIHLDPYGN
jgi:hypothetical protein